MVVVGAHYLPFVFLYGMPAFGGWGRSSSPVAGRPVPGAGGRGRRRLGDRVVLVAAGLLLPRSARERGTRQRGVDGRDARDRLSACRRRSRCCSAPSSTTPPSSPRQQPAARRRERARRGTAGPGTPPRSGRSWSRPRPPATSSASSTRAAGPARARCTSRSSPDPAPTRRSSARRWPSSPPTPGPRWPGSSSGGARTGGGSAFPASCRWPSRSPAVAPSRPRPSPTSASSVAEGDAVVAKYRTGPTSAWPWPDERELAAFLAAATGSPVPFKLTGGLHHAVRGRYEVDGVPGGEPRHPQRPRGHRRGPRRPGARTSSPASSPTATPTRSSPRSAAGRAATAARVRAALTSFGCCTVTDPLGELVELGLLTAP